MVPVEAAHSPPLTSHSRGGGLMDSSDFLSIGLIVVLVLVIIVVGVALYRRRPRHEEAGPEEPIVTLREEPNVVVVQPIDKHHSDEIRLKHLKRAVGDVIASHPHKHIVLDVAHVEYV